MDIHTLIVLCAIASPASATTYHVAQNVSSASDANPGTAEQPWLTLESACGKLKPGDSLVIHAGRYRECARVQTAGRPGSPIALRVFADDEVIIDGADLVPASKWTLTQGFAKVYETDCPRDPGQIFINGEPLYMKLRKLKGKRWELGKLNDEDQGQWQYDGERKKLLLNVGGGNPGDKHRIEIPMRWHGVVLRDYCRVSGVHVTRTASVGIECSADYGVVEDCLVTSGFLGIRGAGWHKTGSIFRRNTVIGMLSNGIYHQDRARGCRIVDNLVVGCTLNPWHQVRWSGSVKINGAYDLLYQNNVVLDAGNPDTPNGWDGWGLWGDCVVGRVYYVGNTAAHNEHAGIYIEAEMTDSHAYYNACLHNRRGITCRASQRGLYMHNLIVGGHAGLSVWHSKGGAPTTDHVFSHNLVRGARLSLHIQQSPQFINHNVYWPPSGRDLAAIGGHQCKGIEDVRRVSGYEAGGEVIDASPEDMGLGVVTFRVRDRKDSDEILMMVGNNGCELRDPVDNNDLPYFWRPGTGDGREHLFRFWPYTGLKPAREAHSGVMYSYGYRGKCGGTLAFAAFQGQAARTGRRCLEVDGQRPERIPEQGLGWWSPSLPARPGDTIRVGFWMRGRDLKPVEAESALAAFAQFTSYTGQMKRSVELAPAAALTGTFGWREVRARVSVPEPARRVAFFFGLRPATGAVFFDDFSIDVEGAAKVKVGQSDQPTGDGRIAAKAAIVRAGPMLHVQCGLSKYPDLRADDQLRVRVKRQWRSLAAKVLPVSPEKRESTVIFNIADWPPDRYKLYVEVLTADFRVRSGRRIPFVIPRRGPGAEAVKEQIVLAGLWRAAMTAPLPQVEGLDKVYADKGLGAAARKLVGERADLSSMREVSVPGMMQDYGEGWHARNGEAVFRRTVVIPPNWIGKNLVLSLGPIDDFDVTFFNGVQVGATDETTPKFYAHPRLYTVPAALLKLGENVIAVRVFDRGWGGGFMGKSEQMFLAPCE